jgi:hypothetical protein
VKPVGADPAHLRREVEDDLGFGVVVAAPDGVLAGQVVLLDVGDEDLRAPLLETLHEVGTEEARPPVTSVRRFVQKLMLCSRAGPHPSEVDSSGRPNP